MPPSRHGIETRVGAGAGLVASDFPPHVPHARRTDSVPFRSQFSDAVEALGAACKEQFALSLAQVGSPRGELLKERVHRHRLIAERIARVRVAHRTVDVPVSTGTRFERVHRTLHYI